MTIHPTQGNDLILYGKKQPSLVPVASFLVALKSLEGIPYIYGGKDPKADLGLDCSGAVTYALLLAGGPDIRATHNAEHLAQECDSLPGPTWDLGCLAFYGHPWSTSHVMTVDRPLMGSGGLQSAYGACGGDSGTITVAAAMARKAKVQSRPRVGYRFDLLSVGRWGRLAY